MRKTSLRLLSEALEQLELPKNHLYVIHNSLFVFGIIEGGVKGVLECISNVLGADSTILMPTYTFSYCDTRMWDSQKSKCETGALSEYFRTRSSTIRTLHPIHSHAVCGPLSEKFENCRNKSSFGEGSPNDILYKLEGINIGLGTNFIGGATFLHHTEEVAKVPYRLYKEFPGKVLGKDGQEVGEAFKMYVRDIQEDFEYDNIWGHVWDDFVGFGLVNQLKLSGANIFSLNIGPTHDFFNEQIQADPYYCAKKILK
jgi:aminoglycoside 3-N-acetyltransferase